MVGSSSTGRREPISNHGDDFSSTILALTASVCLVGSAALYFYYNHGKNGCLDDDKQSKSGSKNAAKLAGISRSDNNGDSNAATIDLPQHIQREIYKEERRKASVKFLAMKKPLYDNIEMYGPDGNTMLCTIGTKKANWYVRKQLALWRDIPNSHPSIRLLFEPKNSKNCKINQKKRRMMNKLGNRETEGVDNDEKLRQYNCTHKLNICVSCGAKDASESNNSKVNGANQKNDESNSGSNNDNSVTTGLMRHYVVPYAYRKLLPTKFKTHLPHDVVLLCLDCHVHMDQEAKKYRTDTYERLFRKDPSTRLAVVIDHDRKRLKSHARALWKHRDRLPPERIQQYEAAIFEHLETESNRITGRTKGASPETQAFIPKTNIPQHILRELAMNLEPERKNPKYIPLADLVVENLCQTDDAITKFVIDWRKFFVETLHPRFLPAGWSVHSPAAIDIRLEYDSDEAKNEENKCEQSQETI